jgi:hypothetical protein
MSDHGICFPETGARQILFVGIVGEARDGAAIENDVRIVP